MDILAISTLFPNAGYPHHGIFVYNRLNAMAKENKITVINPIPTSPLHTRIKKYQPYTRVPAKSRQGELLVYHPTFFSIPRYFKTLEHKTLLKNTLKLVEQLTSDGNQFDCVDVHWTYPDLPVGLEIAKQLNIPCNVTLRGMEAFYADEKDNRPYLIQQCLKQVDGIISLSQEMADYADSIAQTKNKTTVIRNGVNVDLFQYYEQKLAREQLNLSPHDTILFSVGSLIERKGFHLVIQALVELIKQHPNRNFKYYIAGSADLAGDHKKKLDQLIDSLNLQQQVIFIGNKTHLELQKWYNAADIFLLPSYGEGSPNVLTEALSCGCPAIATHVGAVPDIMNASVNVGVIIAPETVSPIIDAVNQLLQKPLDRIAINQYMQQFTWDWCAEKATNALYTLI